MYYQNLLVSFEEFMSLRVSDPFALVEGDGEEEEEVVVNRGEEQEDVRTPSGCVVRRPA